MLAYAEPSIHKKNKQKEIFTQKKITGRWIMKQIFFLQKIVDKGAPQEPFYMKWKDIIDISLEKTVHKGICGIYLRCFQIFPVHNENFL